jgi:hypothetical protein
LPRVIGLDGIKIRKLGRFVVVTDVERKLVLHVWNYSRARHKKDPQAATCALILLKQMDGAEEIEAVMIDISNQFRFAVEQALPQAKIVIDRFHIQRTANEAMGNVRKRLLRELKKQVSKPKMCYASMLRKRWTKLKQHQRDYLEGWFEDHPVLRTAYFAKEHYCRMWDVVGSAAEARQYYEEWTRQFAATVCETREQAEMRKDFKVILSAMLSWGEYVFNYFDLDRKHTNAFTEWSNRRIRDIRRESRGCNVGVMRSKLIYGTWLNQRLRRGSRKWGEKTVVAKKTRRPSAPAPEKEAGATELARAPRQAPKRRGHAEQLSLLFEE